MSTIDLLNDKGKKGGTVELPDDLFNVTANIPLIHQVVTAQLAAARQGTHATKTRGQVAGGGAKPWRQKGTGRARHGSRRSPIWTGGGVAHGPQPRSYAQKTPKRMIQAALLGALSDRAREDRVFVIKEITHDELPSTKQAATVLSAFNQYRQLLVVLDRDDYIGWLSTRNLAEAHVITVDQLNAYDVIVADAIVFTKTAIEVFAADKGSTVTVTEVKSAKKSAKAETADDDEAADEKPATKAAAKKPAAKAETAPAKKPAAKAETAPAKKPAAKAETAPAKKPAAKAESQDKAPATKKPAADKPAAKPKATAADKEASK